jgi:hypothetical protein
MCSCPGYNCLYVTRAALACHQTMHHTQIVIRFRDADVFNNIIFSSFGLDMDCIIRYHRCLPSWFTMLYSYHHIPYALHVEIQYNLHIPLAWLAINPSNIIAWHAYLFFHSWCLSFVPCGGEKGHQEIHAHLH